MPKITVFTPTYNRGYLIKETIESVLKQNFKDFEFLIVDDGSTDNTEEIVSPYLKDKRVNYIKRKNVGEAETTNFAWSIAKGEYFTQVNSDDPILPGLFSEMVKVLDSKKNVVVAYPDFYFIDINGKVIKQDKNIDWVFPEALTAFSCYAASAGTFIRRSAFSSWKKIKDNRFRHISDIYMYWNMALVGDFYHVPKFLATWRDHTGGISAKRWEAIPEIEIWLKEYFSQKGLPREVLVLKDDVKTTVYKYFLNLLDQADSINQAQLINLYKKKLGQKIYDFKNLQVGDNDLIGNKFNGHDLHKYLKDKNIESSHLVWNKESADTDTYIIAAEKPEREKIRQNTIEIQAKYSLNSILNPIAYDILYNKLFLTTDIVHFHLLHNYIFDIQLLPILSRLKPIVWTIHDPWVLGGHCTYHFNCEKWQDQCGECSYLTTPFILDKDNSALNFEIKKQAIQNSNIEVIVASKWMAEKLEKSPVFKNKDINIIPFGVNQDIFRPMTKKSIRRKLDIPEDAIVLCFRCDYSQFKGMDYIEYVLENIKTKKKIFLLLLANDFNKKFDKFGYRAFGWVNDDERLAQIYNASDLFLMPSKMEAFGMMAIEAMSSGVLPIVLEGTALPEVVNSSKCGVATPNNKEEYLKAVQYYIDHNKERILRAKKCLEFAQKEYKKDIYVKRVISLYKTVMKKFKISKYNEFLLAQLRRNMTINPQTYIKYQDALPRKKVEKIFMKLVKFFICKFIKLIPKKTKKDFGKKLSKYKNLKKRISIFNCGC
jgi:glycosyltransferase involved in cell wall biosynthesis